LSIYIFGLIYEKAGENFSGEE